MKFADYVYKTLKGKVPRGKVATYSTLAKAIGKPNAARAVGNALNRNPHAPIVPCHRVVKSSGEIGGFASGIGKKVTLLRKEGVEVIANKVPKRFILTRL
ncbi:MAG TPA: MGMT family protein [Candidatus Nanoarchaeia archaeon]|nr:MGMT family protein [Candidatus Nanoarchaeia archaeon]